jgi:translation initiation factor eIF-2B subunit epsilon
MALAASMKVKQKGGLDIPAVIFADSFDVFHQPLSLEMPRTLFPICNVPLLDHTIEFLASQGITEIYVFCCAHANKVKDHLNNSFWLAQGLKLETIIRDRAQSEGDALRELSDTRLLQKDDFVLVSGDGIANIDLKQVISLHKQQRKKDKECVMTTVLREARYGHHTRAAHDNIILAVNDETQQIIAFDASSDAKYMQFDKSNLGKEHVTISCRYDVMDCRISVCSPEVLYQFKDNFDYTKISQYISGVVNEEILGAKIYACFISGSYAARVNCFRSYRAITQDIINRWTYPMVPDVNFTNTTTYKSSRNQIYREKNVFLARSVNIKANTVIGEGTRIGGETAKFGGVNTQISHSTIGRRCKIGDNVTITGCYLWDDVVIGDNVTIVNSLLATGVTIKSNVSIPKGCVISFGVVVGEGIQLKPFTKLTCVTHKMTSPIDLGVGGKGSLWLEAKIKTGSDLVRRDDEPIGEELPDEESDDTPTAVIYESTRKKFLKTIARCVTNTYEGGGFTEANMANVRSDLTATKLAFDVSFFELVEALIIALLEMTSVSKLSQFKQFCKAWSGLIGRFLKGADQNIEMQELIFKIQEYCEEHKAKNLDKEFDQILKILYDTNIVSEQAVLGWAAELSESEEPEEKKIYDLCKPFIDSLAETDSISITESDEEDFQWDKDEEEGESLGESGSKKNDGSNDDNDEDGDDSFSFDDDDI